MGIYVWGKHRSSHKFEFWQGFSKALQIPESPVPGTSGDLMEVTQLVKVKPGLEPQKLHEQDAACIWAYRTFLQISVLVF